MKILGRKARVIFLFILILLSSEALFFVEAQVDYPLAQVDNSITYQDQEYLVIKDITLKGNGQGVGLTIKDCSHLSLYNIHIENFAIGIKIEGGLANNIYNPQLIYNTEIGLLITGDYGITRVFGGSIIGNRIGVKIDQSSMMNQFYGVEMELNTHNELTLGNSTYGNLFEGCYFERSDATSKDFFDMTKTTGSNTFYANKFASQIESNFEVFGDSNVFRDNIFDSGVVSLSIHGAKNVFTDNRQGEIEPEVIVADTGTATRYQNNFFITDNSPQLPTKNPEIPEYSIIAIMFAFIVTTLLAIVVIYKKIYNKRPQRQS